MSRRNEPLKRPPRRMFTRAEDEFLLANCTSMSMNKISIALRCDRDTAIRRAVELGLKPIVVRTARVKAKNDRHRKYVPSAEYVYHGPGNEQPHVGDDPLLRRLYEVHGKPEN